MLHQQETAKSSKLPKVAVKIKRGIFARGLSIYAHLFLRKKTEKQINPCVSSRYGGNAKVVHFLGKTKPWNFTYDPKAKQIGGSVHEATTHPTFLLDWWSLYSSEVVPMLQDQYGDLPFHSGCVEVNDAAVQLDWTVWEDLKYRPPLHLLSFYILG